MYSSEASEFVSFDITPGEDLSVPLVRQGKVLVCATGCEVSMTEEKPDSPSEKMITVTFVDQEVPGAMPLKKRFFPPNPSKADYINRMRKAEWFAYCEAFGLPLEHDTGVVRATQPTGFVMVEHSKWNGRPQANITSFLKATV